MVKKVQDSLYNNKINSGPKVLINKEGIPLGPRALRGCICFSVVSISVVWNACSRAKFISSVTLGCIASSNFALTAGCEHENSCS